MNELKYQKYYPINFEDNKKQKTHWLNRALFVLSFKDTHTQNLRFITKVLGITAPDERDEYVKELLRMVQRGIIYIPKGLPYLIEKESKFNLDNPVDQESIELCLLHPFKKLISELQTELSSFTTEEEILTVDVH